MSSARQPSRAASARATVVYRRHESDQVDLVRRHRVSRANSSKNPGYDTSTEMLR
jgi:hypothetical protein